MTVIRGIDSWWEPTDQQIAAAKAQGYGAWLGYFKQPPPDNNDGIFNGWSDDAFRRVLAGGIDTAAFVSSRQDAAWVKARAAALGIVTILDCEPSVLGNAWSNAAAQDAWLAQSGSGIYGSGPRYGATNVVAQHRDHGHPCLVVSDYESIPGAGAQSWPNDPLPAAPTVTGWQYAGSVTLSFGTVDLSIFDPALLAVAPVPPPPPPEEVEMLLINTPSQGVWLLSGSLFVHVDTPAVESSLLNDGNVKAVTIDDAFFNLLWHASTAKTDVLLNTIIAKVHEAPAAVIAWPTTPQGGITTIQLWYRVIDGTLVQFNDPVLGGTEQGYALKAGIVNAARVEAAADLENHINVTVYNAQGGVAAAVYYDGTWHGTDLSNPQLWTPTAGQATTALQP